MLYWDPSREMFSYTLPFLGRPILWYGFFFALGFFCGYWVLRYRLSRTLATPSLARPLADRMTFFVILGTIIGARLGDILFYNNLAAYFHRPLDIFKVWEGGLASHGGAAGILIGIFILSKRKKQGFPSLSFPSLVDLVALSTPLVAGFIRIGNFFNQEILGKPSIAPWAVTFGHPADGSPPEPRHPVQLYEALYYFCTFALLFFLAPKIKRPGKITGLFLLLTFSFRFLIEFFKEEQSVLLTAQAWLTMGQLLSMPFVCLGVFLYFRRKQEPDVQQYNDK